MGYGSPNGELYLSGGTLFGTSFNSGSYGPGFVFEINTNASGFANIYSFSTANYYSKSVLTNAEGGYQSAGLVLSGSTAYGAAAAGGTNGNGTIYRLQIPAVLSIAKAGTNVLVTWPSLNTGYTLQSATNLASPAWKSNSPSPGVVNGQNTVTNPISGTRQFYRLTQ